MVKSNNDPRVPGKLFLEYVKEVGGCPLLLVSDCGTENGIAAAMQGTFRSSGQDDQAGERGHIGIAHHQLISVSKDGGPF